MSVYECVCTCACVCVFKLMSNPKSLISLLQTLLLTLHQTLSILSQTDVLYQVINHLSKQASSVPAAPPSLASASNASAVTTATETPAAEDSNQKNQLYANQA